MTETAKKNEVTPASLVEKLVAAANAIKAVDKDGENTFQHYSFQSEAAIKHAVKDAIGAQGIVIIPSYEITNQYDRTSSKDKVTHFVDVMGTFTITDGQSSQVGTMPGSGQDTAEKAMAKACTSAQKYFYKQLFNISDQDEDGDADNSQPQGYGKRTPTPIRQRSTSNGKATDKQVKMISAQIGRIAKLNGSKEADYEHKMLMYINDKYEVTDFRELTGSQASTLIKQLMEKANKAQLASPAEQPAANEQVPAGNTPADPFADAQ